MEIVSASDMIKRFRESKPTSRNDRHLEQNNVKRKMWWEASTTSDDENDINHRPYKGRANGVMIIEVKSIVVSLDTLRYLLLFNKYFIDDIRTTDDMNNEVEHPRQLNKEPILQNPRYSSNRGLSNSEYLKSSWNNDNNDQLIFNSSKNILGISSKISTSTTSTTTASIITTN